MQCNWVIRLIHRVEWFRTLLSEEVELGFPVYLTMARQSPTAKYIHSWGSTRRICLLGPSLLGSLAGVVGERDPASPSQLDVDETEVRIRCCCRDYYVRPRLVSRFPHLFLQKDVRYMAGGMNTRSCSLAIVFSPHSQSPFH